jgi:large subunit ribosomal protein L46
MAGAQATVEAPPISQLTPDEPAVALTSQPSYTVKAGVLLTRAPLITSDLHPFERAYHFYQRRLNERLVLPFTQYFYYKRGTPSFEHWRKSKAARGGVPARDVGKYNAYGPDNWHDEVLVGDSSGERDTVLTSLVAEEGRGAEFAGESGSTETAGLRRETDADRNNDQQSLERQLQRTLYLLVKEKGRDGKRGNWILPSGVVASKEGIAEVSSGMLHCETSLTSVGCKAYP